MSAAGEKRSSSSNAEANEESVSAQQQVEQAKKRLRKDEEAARELKEYEEWVSRFRDHPKNWRTLVRFERHGWVMRGGGKSGDTKWLAVYKEYYLGRATIEFEEEEVYIDSLTNDLPRMCAIACTMRNRDKKWPCGIPWKWSVMVCRDRREGELPDVPWEGPMMVCEGEKELIDD